MEDDLDPLLNGLSGPLGDVIAQVGEGLAAAQQALDLQALENLRALAVGEGPADQSLRDIGYRPTFYHIPECTVEMKVALTLSGRISRQGRIKGRGLYAMPVDAGYANGFDYGVEASSKLSFRIVPVPPPADLDGRVAVPRLIGRRLDEARATARGFGLEVQPDPAGAPDDALIDGQSPEPGEIVAEGSRLVVTVTA